MEKKSDYPNRIRLIVFTISLIVVNIFTVSNNALCAPALTRDKAAALIEKNMSAFKHKVHLHENGYTKGFLHGMWLEIDKSSYLTKKGAAYFASIEPPPLFKQHSGSGTLLNPVNIQVKVTGIRNSMGSQAAADFTWEYAGLPSAVKRYAVKGGDGNAQLTLYDDGWRLTNIFARYLDKPVVLTAKEKTVDEKETTTGIQREARCEEQRFAEETRLSNLFETATTSIERATLITIPPQYSFEKPTELVTGGANLLLQRRGDFQKAVYYTNIWGFWFLFDRDDGNYKLGVCERPRKVISGECSWGQGYVIAKTRNAPEDLEKAYQSLTEAFVKWQEKNKEVVAIIENNQNIHFERGKEPVDISKSAGSYIQSIRWRDLKVLNRRINSEDACWLSSP